MRIIVLMVLSVFPWIYTSSQQPVRELLLECANKEVGVKETSENDSPRIQEYIKSCGFSTPVPWCGCFLTFLFKELSLNYPSLPARAASWTLDNTYKNKYEANSGDVFTIYYSSLGRVGHVGLIEAVDADYVYSIEGNGLTMKTKIITTTGFIELKDLKLGQEIASPYNEKSTVTGIFPQGIRKTYKITFSDGSVVEADENHLWQVNILQRKGSFVLNTLELIDKLNKGQKISIPHIKPTRFENNTTFKIDPYILGLLLGDGTFRNEKVAFTAVEPELVLAMSEGVPIGNKLNNYSKNDYTIVYGDIKNDIRELNLFGCSSHDKFIPEKYKFTTVENRIAILQGLMDTDGSIDKVGRAEYCSVSKTLAEDVQFLIQSLGGKVTIYKKENIYYTSPTQKTPKKASDAYILRNIRFPKEVDIQLFRLKRKADRFNEFRDKAFYRGWSIQKIEYIGEHETACISVSAPSKLYLVNNFIPTHNTNNNILDGGDYDGDKVMKKLRPWATLYKTANWIGDKYYTVKPGDNLYRISLTHKVSVERLKQLNNIKENYIKIGQRLQIS